MSTRAIYTFKDDASTIHVYKHHDGYPEGAAQHLESAKAYAWALPRFEADEFAGAFVAACKAEAKESRDEYTKKTGQSAKALGDNFTGGGIRLIGVSPEGKAIQPHRFAGDVEYRYEITHDGKSKDVTVRAFRCNYWDGKSGETQFYNGKLAKLATAEADAA